MTMKRREFFKRSAWFSLVLGGHMFGPGWLRRNALAGPTKGPKKMIYIFLRGGNDGVNTVIPRGDPDYSTETRPTLYIPEATALDTGNGFAQMHPALEPMLDIYNHVDLNGVEGPGNLALLHRVGYQGQTRSHFDSQHYWETGVPGDPSFEEGMLYRHVAHGMNLAENSLVAAAMSSSQLLALKGPLPVPNIPNAANFRFSGSAGEVEKFLGSLPQQPQGGDGTGMLGLYGGTRDAAGKPYRDLVFGTGLALSDAMQIVQEAVAQGDYVPSNAAVYPDGSFGERLEQAAMLMKRTPAQVLGLNVSGWDTHTNQGAAFGNHRRLLTQVAEAYQALWLDLADQWDDLLVVTMTEFGRTSRENGSVGTDHGQSSVMFVAGGAVKGGVYNCDADTWAPGDMFSERDRYLKERTDFRAVFAEIFMRHFGDDQALIDAIIPGYADIAAQQPDNFTPLNFLPA